MDVSYLVDGVMDGATGRALRWSDVLASTVAFNVVATTRCCTREHIERPLLSRQIGYSAALSVRELEAAAPGGVR